MIEVLHNIRTLIKDIDVKDKPKKRVIFYNNTEKYIERRYWWENKLGFGREKEIGIVLDFWEWSLRVWICWFWAQYDAELIL